MKISADIRIIRIIAKTKNTAENLNFRLKYRRSRNNSLCEIKMQFRFKLLCYTFATHIWHFTIRDQHSKPTVCMPVCNSYSKRHSPVATCHVVLEGTISIPIIKYSNSLIFVGRFPAPKIWRRIRLSAAAWGLFQVLQWRNHLGARIRAGNK